jgi:hypothetical protein
VRDPVDPVEDDPAVDVVEEDPGEVDEGLPPPVVEIEVEVGLVKSSWKVPESRCCWRVASADGELGGTVPKAHMTS